MGRKKRKTDNAAEAPAPVIEDPPTDPSLSSPISKVPSRIPKKEHSAVVDVPLCVPVNTNQPPPPQPTLIQSIIPKIPLKDSSKATTSADKNVNANANANADASLAGGPKASGYAMTSHSADLITEDIYVSDGSEDEDEMENSDPLELNLTSSKMGLMRRGLGHSAVYQPKTWVRPTETEKKTNENGQDGDGDQDMKESEDEKEDLESMDPIQRAAYLLVEKQKKLEEEKETQRKSESAENAGRDPCLFSKRTAFDIRMDQIEEKPWDRNAGGGGDISDYFNYGMSELDWVEYSEQQKMVRQELTDASRQRRNPDPTIVPVVPQTPSRQAPRVAVAVKKADDDDDDDVEMSNVAVGPTLPTKVKAEDNKIGNGDSEKDSETKDDAADASISEKAESSSVTVSVAASVGLVGGAWGAPPGSKLAKLIEEQENRSNVPPPPVMHQMPPGPPPPQHRNEWGNQGRGDDRYQHGRGGGGRGRGNYYQQQNHDQGGYQPNQFQQDFSAPPPPHGNWHGRPNQHQQHDRYPPNNFQQDFSAPPPPHGNFHGGGRGGRGDYRGGRGSPGRGPPPGRGYGGRGRGGGNWRPRY